MKKYSILAAFLASFAILATEVNINGGFEQIKPERGGKVSPAGWLVSEKLSKNFDYKISRTPGTFRSGNFGMIVETQENGRVFFQRLDRMQFPVGKKLQFTFWAKGTGRIYCGFFCFGRASETSPETFLRTILNVTPQLKEVEEWTEYKVVIPIVPQKVKDTVYNLLYGRVCMMFNANSEIYIDDMKLEIIGEDKK
ncbi:MAG: hypothetical protein J6W81_08990 [Lentisphaeria bacterium]|nr:hypothetical protein [Lentisphaeria bacterium]